MKKTISIFLCVVMLVIMMPININASDRNTLTNENLLNDLGYIVENGSVSNAKINNGKLEITSTAFSIISLPSGGAQIPYDMTNYTYEVDITPIVFNGTNYCGIIYGHSTGTTYSGRAQFKMKTTAVDSPLEFWCTGAASGVQTTDARFASGTFGVNVATNLKIVVSGSNMIYYVNGIETVTSSSGNVSKKLALLVNTGCIMAFDNIKVTNNETSTTVYDENFACKGFAGVQESNVTSLVDNYLLNELGYNLANGTLSGAKINNGKLEIASTGFSIISLPSGEAQIPSNMTNYTYEVDITPIVFNGTNYSGIIYGHSTLSTYSGRAQFKMKTTAVDSPMEFWCTGAASGVQTTDARFAAETFGVGNVTNLKIVVSGSNMTYYVNGIETATSSSGNVSQNLALLVTVGSTMAFDNIKVTNNDTSLVVYEENFEDIASYTVTDVVQNIRFVAIVDSLDYNSVGFEIVAQYNQNEEIINKSFDKNNTKVFASITDYNNNAYDADSLSGAYIYTITINNIPTNIGAITFTVKPYTIIDSVKTYMDTKTVVYIDGIYSGISG